MVDELKKKGIHKELENIISKIIEYDTDTKINVDKLKICV